MTWLGENLQTVATILVILWGITQFILHYLAKRSKNKKLEKLANNLDEIMQLAVAKDSVLKQTFRNVEELKKLWKGSGLEESYGKIGTLFKDWNENLDMESMVRELYITLLGKEIGLAPDSEDGSESE